MICPHCQSRSTYRQRNGTTCGSCHREFAFEPKNHPLMLHDRRFRNMTYKLSRDGLLYTADQLRYALSRKPIAAHRRLTTGGAFILVGAAALIVGLMVAGGVSPAAGAVVAVVVAIVGALVVLRVPGEPYYPTLPLTESEFRSQVLDRWCRVYGRPPSGLVDADSLRDAAGEERPLAGLAAVVVCPERDVLICLLANHVPRDLRVGLLPTAAPFDEWETELLELLRSSPRLPILLLHDASAAGVFLSHDLPRLLGLDPAHRIYDLGLNPRTSIEKRRLTLHGHVTDALHERLDTESIGGDVAGTRAIRRGRAAVSEEEIAWLREGFYSPILAIGPSSLIRRLRFALEKIASKRRAARPAETVGFLTWPE